MIEAQYSSKAEDAQRLSLHIKRWQASRRLAGLPSKQADLGVMAGGISQSAVSQYATGVIPLNIHALRLFSSALGVSPDEISPSLSQELIRFNAQSHKSSAGMVYEWHEMDRIFNLFGSSYLPDVFSVEIPGRDVFGGLLRAGDIAILSRLQQPDAGDGVVISRPEGGGSQAVMEFAVCWKGESGQAVYQAADGHIITADDARWLFTVSGMPTLRWPRLMRWRA